MKKLLILFVLLFCLTSESCKENTSVTAHGTEKGYLVVKKDKLSFGQINRNTNKNIKCSFELTNKGNKPITIHKIDVSCGCLSAEISSNIILPQEKTMLTIRVNPRKQLGHFNKSVYVNSDAENPVII